MKLCPVILNVEGVEEIREVGDSSPTIWLNNYSLLVIDLLMKMQACFHGFLATVSTVSYENISAEGFCYEIKCLLYGLSTQGRHFTLILGKEGFFLGRVCLSYKYQTFILVYYNKYSLVQNFLYVRLTTLKSDRI